MDYSNHRIQAQFAPDGIHVVSPGPKDTTAIIWKTTYTADELAQIEKELETQAEAPEPITNDDAKIRNDGKITDWDAAMGGAHDVLSIQKSRGSERGFAYIKTMLAIAAVTVLGATISALLILRPTMTRFEHAVLLWATLGIGGILGIAHLFKKKADLLKTKFSKALMAALGSILIIAIASVHLNASENWIFHGPFLSRGQEMVTIERSLWQIFFSAVLVAPILEEVAFRAGIFRALRDGLGRLMHEKTALIASLAFTSLLFGLAHPSGYLGVRVATGVAAGLLYHRYGLTAAMLFHGFWNFYVMSIVLFFSLFALPGFLF